MQPEIVRYRHPASLFSGAVGYDADTLVVTAQKGVARRYNDRRRKEETSPKGVFVFALLNELLPDWFSGERSFFQHILLSRLIDSTWERNGEPGGEVLLRAFRHNRGELLTSLRELVEIGVEPGELPESTPEETLFARIYEGFVADPESGVPLFREEVDRWSRPSTFLKLVAGVHPERDDPPVGRFAAVCLQGFYYVRPLQARLLDAFARTGIHVTYLNAYDPDHAVAFEIWERNPRYANGWTVRSAEDAPVAITPPERIIKFADLFSMVRYVRERGRARRIVPMAPFSDEVAERLEPFFPKEEAKSRLLSYPIGRYLWGIYSMWDPNAGALVLDVDTVRLCLSTGWADEPEEGRAESTGSSVAGGASAFETFERVEDYFADCRTVDAWTARLAQLETTINEVLPLFRRPNDDPRWAAYLGSPFAALDVFNTPVDDVRRLVAALRGMTRTASALFSDIDENVDLLKHFARLRKLLLERADRVRVDSEEREVLATFLQRLNAPVTSIVACPPEHLCSAVRFFLGGKRRFDFEEDAPLGPVHALSDIESVLLEPERELFLCCCDGRSLPGRTRPLSWPLTESLLERTALSNDAARRRDELLYRVRSVVIANRFLFHMARLHPALTLSWVAKEKGKDIPASIYLLRLAAQGVPTESSEALLVGVGRMTEVEPAPESEAIEATIRKTLVKTCPPELKFSMRLCPAGSLRLWYDCVLAASSGYSRRYQLQFLFSQMIETVAGVRKCPTSVAAREIFALYPSFTESEREQCANFGERFRKRYWTSDFFEAARKQGGLSPSRLLVRYIPHNRVVNLLGTKNPADREDCRYCPHADRCFARHRYE